MVGAEFLQHMKETAFLLNTSRGPLVDEPALAKALAENRIAGAALDVLTQEPLQPDNPLIQPDAPFANRIVVTPHNAWVATEARAQLQNQVAANIQAYLNGQPINVV